VEELLKLIEWATSNGPLGVVLVLAIILAVVIWTLVRAQVRVGRSPEVATIEELKELVADYERLTNDYHEVAVNIAKTMERLTTLLDERTRRQDRRH
jgi:Na+-transporting methylmalonyl-CoA/oxaloacetate decarboxylase gamma subunit